jgi:hypothetical protein
MRRPTCSAFVLCFAITAADAARAQVNTEPLRDKIHEKGLSGLLQATLDGHTGNTEGVTADALIGGGAASGRHLAFAFASADYARLNGTLGVDKSFAHVRYVYELEPSLWWEVYAQAQRDVFQRIRIRDLAGSGPRLALLRDPQFNLYLGVSYLVESDATTFGPGQTGEWAPFTQRASAYLTEHTKLAEHIVTAATVYVQPALTDVSNMRVSAEAGFIFTVSKWLSTNIAFSGHYDSRPPPGVLPTDTELKNAIALTW